MQAKDAENKLIFNTHYGIIEKGNTLHATSNIPKEILITQKIGLPIPSLIKKGAENPGTIVTIKPNKVDTKLITK
jgi:hypothetical protein